MNITGTSVRSLIEGDPGGDPEGEAIVQDLKSGEINLDAVNGYIDSVHEMETHYLKMIHTMHKMVLALRVRESLKKAGVDEKDVVEYVSSDNHYGSGTLGRPFHAKWKIEPSDIVGVKVRDPQNPKAMPRFIEFDQPLRRAGREPQKPDKFTGYTPAKKPAGYKSATSAPTGYTDYKGSPLA